MNAWPRMGVYRMEVLKSVALPWIRMQEEGGDGNGFEEIKEECKLTVQVLKDSLSDSAAEFDKEVAELVKVDKRLEGLFSD